MVVAAKQKHHSTRLAKYSVAAVAVAATGLTTADVDAAIVSSGNLGNALLSVNSVERFVSLNGFAEGALVFGGYTNGTNTSSVASPLGGNTDIMLRGFGAFNTAGGEANIRIDNGGFVPYSEGGHGDELAINVGAVGNTFPFAGVTYLAFSNRVDLVDKTGPDYGNFDNPPTSGFGSDGIVYFQFTNKSTGLMHNGWLDITISDGGGVGT
ncbi:MAG: hypothetical protein ACR2NP_20140, partial [Pirellulaceae bacterium]